MIYLIKSPEAKKLENGEYEFFFSLKIGYTEDEETNIKKNRRLNQYFNHHRSIEILHIIPNGTEEQEKKLHYKFKNLRWDSSNEWYIYDQSIVDYFKSVTLEELDKLPSCPDHDFKESLKGRKEAKLILSYVTDFNKKELDEYIEKLSKNLGVDIVLRDKVLDFIRKDLNISEEKLNKFFEIENNKKNNCYCDDPEMNKMIVDFFSVYDSFSFMYDKLRYLCEFSKNPTVSQELIEAVLSQLSDSDEVKSYFIALGPDKLKSLGYSITRIKKELGIAIFDKNLLINSIYSVFKVGDKITLSELKEDLSKLYKGINYDKTPKAVDIEGYFEVKPLLLSIEENGVKKRAKGYELISSYEDRIRLDMRMSK